MSSAVPILQIIVEVRKYLEHYGSDVTGIDQVLAGLYGFKLSGDRFLKRTPQVPQHLRGALENAIHGILDPELKPIRTAIENAKSSLHWRVDDGLYYDSADKIGEAYTNNNMHCELIGPQSADVLCEDFRFGLFLLGPRILYRDHYHAAPEFYLNLTGPSRWRFDLGPWQDHGAGSMLWNEENKVHATCVGDQTFLSVYVWTENVHNKCQVVPSSDWDAIEDSLTTNK